MTSRNLFFKLSVEDIKRRIWTIVLSFIVFFLYFPVIGTLMIGNYEGYISDYSSKAMLYPRILEYLGPKDYLVGVITVVGAIICGLSGFFYLHSKKQVDFYHSLPIRREILFGLKYLNGLLIYVIPYIFNVVIYSIILKFNGLMDFNLWKEAWKAIGIHFLFFALIYTVVIIAVMLTGNIVVGCFGTIVFLLYGPTIRILKEIYYTSFFTTYYPEDVSAVELFNFISPVGNYLNVLKKIRNDGNIHSNILVTLVVTVLLIALALFLYKKRPSEAAGKAMAFRISKPVVKFLLVIPLSLGGGIIFREITNRQSDGWFVFGLLFTLLVVYAVIEITYNFDIKNAFHHKKQLLISGIIVGMVAGVFRFDLLHYDTYLPKKESIESMSVAITGLDEFKDYHSMKLDNRNYLDYMDGERYQLQYMKLTDMEAAYGMVSEVAKNKAVTEDEDSYLYYNVKFNLKNGKEVARAYQLKESEEYPMLKDIYENQKFKEGHYPIYRLDMNLITEIYCSNVFEGKQITLNREEKKELVDILKEELSNLTLDKIRNENPIGVVSIQLYNMMEDYNIYPDYKKTIDFLKKHGFDAERKVEGKDLAQMTIYQVGTESEEIGSNIEETVETQDQVITYGNGKDLDKMEKVFPELVEYDYYWANRSVIEVEDSIDVEVVFRKDEYGNEERKSYRFRKGAIPDFVKENINLEEGR